MFIVVPVLLVMLVVAVWSIVSGVSGILSQREPGAPDRRKIPDIMTFLQQRRKPRGLPSDETRRPLIRR